MIWSKTHNWVINICGTHTVFFVWLDFLILFSSLKLKNFEWEWWKPKTPNWCFQFLRYITQWQDCKFLTSVGSICIDGVISLTLSSLFLLPLFYFSFFLWLLSLYLFFLSFFLSLVLCLVLSFFLSLVQPSSAATIKARASKHQDHDHRCWVLILSHQVTSLSNPEIKLCRRIGLSQDQRSSFAGESDWAQVGSWDLMLHRDRKLHWRIRLSQD